MIIIDVYSTKQLRSAHVLLPRAGAVPKRVGLIPSPARWRMRGRLWPQKSANVRLAIFASD